MEPAVSCTAPLLLGATWDLLSPECQSHEPFLSRGSVKCCDSWSPVGCEKGNSQLPLSLPSERSEVWEAHWLGVPQGWAMGAGCLSEGS